MKVTFVTTSFPVFKLSTSGIFVYKLVDELSKLLDCDVITPASSKAMIPSDKVHLVNYAPRSLQTICHEPGGIPSSFKLYPIRTALLLPVLFVALLISTAWRGRKSDILCGNWSLSGLVCALVGKILNKKSVVILRGADANLDGSIWSPVSMLTRSAVKLCSHVVMVSDSLGNDLVTGNQSIGEKITVINNGVETIEHNRRTPKDEVFTVVSVGSLIPRKDYFCQIKAAKLLEKVGVNFRWLVVGDGPLYSDLHETIVQEGLSNSFIFLGEKSHEETLGILANADCFVMTSLSEGRSNALLEAMASGVAVIVSEIPSTESILANSGAGILVPVGDSLSLKAELVELLEHPDRRISFGENGRRWIENNDLTWASCASKYKTLFESLVA